MLQSPVVMKASTVQHIAQLANIPITDEEEKKLAQSFEETLETINDLQTVDVKNVEPTHQVTGLTNVLREDEIDDERMFTQEEALSNAKRTWNGYFVVEQILDQE